MGWIGDPIWLEEVLRPALGERLRVLDGWRERGHGDFRDILRCDVAPHRQLT